MAFWRIFGKKNTQPQKVTSGRFEIEREGEIAYLDYSLDGKVLELIHTEVPEKLRGQGLASLLAETGLRFAREKNLKVDVVCPVAKSYVAKHPEYSELILR